MGTGLLNIFAQYTVGLGIKKPANIGWLFSHYIFTRLNSYFELEHHFF
ncbi:hypothetical protein PCIT_b0695 [Pseudoalteromonas citrea]|uniref:Uncharacterized protein n=1 Tax=Pseudoalteromonas citrea TaxID=43655 RepID=A0AAD4AF10_9GAMM|nr:hypothetical protein PCIT_b0695 [Pseudoalteromonas citrea]